jgi:hypothetical protein
MRADIKAFAINAAPRKVFSFCKMPRNIVSLFKRFGRRVFRSPTSNSCKPLYVILNQRVMKTLLLFIFILTCANPAISQTNKCIPKTDSSDVVKIAKRKGIYWTKNWQYGPTLKLDTLTCNWAFFSGKSHHTTKGDCKYTNGCTATTTATLVVGAATGKIISFKKEKHLYHNYE